MKLLIVGPGRAGGSLSIAASAAGHDVVGVVSKTGDTRFGPPLTWDVAFPNADIALIAVRDSQIEDVALDLLKKEVSYPVVAHVSGFESLKPLEPLVAKGSTVGGFHPLQTLPDAETGAEALDGAYVAVAGEGLAWDMLTHLGDSMGMVPFYLSDDDRPAYHAAAAAAANFVVTCLAISSDLMESANLDPTIVSPLVRRVVENALGGDADVALTGPIARGDLETVIGHLTAARRVSVDVGEQFRLMAEATAIRSGRREESRLWR